MRDWRSKNPDFAAFLKTARASHLTEQVGNITATGKRDWKAAAWLVERGKETREDYGRNEYGDRTVQVILNINRGDDDQPEEKQIGPRVIDRPACNTASAGPEN